MGMSLRIGNIRLETDQQQNTANAGEQEWTRRVEGRTGVGDVWYCQCSMIEVKTTDNQIIYT